MENFKEYDVVISNKQIENVPPKCKGTVLIVYDENHFEVEFVNSLGETIGILTVSGENLQKV